jgi:2-phospho-L-lactate transferase/gluconeogenesis factor (CofD/UPF0052 family)
MSSSLYDHTYTSSQAISMLIKIDNQIDSFNDSLKMFQTKLNNYEMQFNDDETNNDILKLRLDITTQLTEAINKCKDYLRDCEIDREFFLKFL